MTFVWKAAYKVMMFKLMKKTIKQGNPRKTGKEQFYTIPSVAQKCVDRVKNLIGSLAIVEPAGGSGAFIKALGRYKIFSWDIEPQFPGVVCGDFLKQNLSSIGDCFVISNPPFGRANSLSRKFFNHSASFTNVKYIAFIVPKSWRKWSLVNSLNDDFHLIIDDDLPNVSFCSLEGEPYGSNLRTIFQVWERREYKRQKIIVEDLGLIKRVNPNEADIAITLFGWSCGKILRNFDRTKKNSCLGYFKVSSPEIIDLLGECDFSKFYENTSTTWALSDKEIKFLLKEKFYASREE